MEDSELLDAVKGTGGRARPRGRKRAESVQVELEDHEAGYVGFLTWHLAERAGKLPEVRRFREKELGGEPLTAERAMELLRGRELEARGLPTDPESMTDDELEAAADVMGMTRGELLRPWAPSLVAGLGSYDEHVFPRDAHLGLVDWPKRWGWDKRDDERLGWNADGAQPMYKNLWEPARQPGLAELSRGLATLYPWRPADAAWFVLTGEPPEVVGAELSYDHQRNLFTLVFAPWISEKTLQRAYRGARGHLRLGGYRPLEDKTVAALRFAHENTDGGAQQSVPWSRLRSLWNRQHPGQRFASLQAFRQACLRAEEWLGIR